MKNANWTETKTLSTGRKIEISRYGWHTVSDESGQTESPTCASIPEVDEAWTLHHAIIRERE